MMPSFILSDEWMRSICESQGIQWDKSTRVIIDGKAGEPVMLYITQLGTDEILNLTLPDVQEPDVSIK